MNKCVLIITILVMTLVIVSENDVIVTVNSRERIVGQIVKYNVNVTGPEAIGAGVVTPINVTVQLNPTTTEPVTNISVSAKIPSFEQGGDFWFIPGNKTDYTRTQEIGDFSPGEIKKTSFLINSTGNDTFMMVRIYLYEAGEEQTIRSYNREDKDWLTGIYASFGIALTFPQLKISGPFELQGQVVPRLRLIENEEVTLTYNVSNIRGDPIINLAVWIKSPDTLQILDINVTYVAILENNSYFYVVIKGKCTVNYSSLKRLHFYVDADNIELRERVVKVQTYDWYNPLKIDNKIALITWPLMMVVMATYTVLFLRFSWKKHKERVRITKELEERYGRALDVPD